MKLPVILTDFIHLFFPNLCLLCKKPLVKDEKQICLGCLCDLNYCRIADLQQNPVYELFYAQSDIQGAYAWLAFEKGGRTQKLIHSLKYYNNKALGYQLGTMAARDAVAKHFFKDIDLVIPVPLHRNKRRKRGYNQAELIAGSVSEILHVPVDNTVLLRKKQSASQVKMNFFER